MKNRERSSTAALAKTFKNTIFRPMLNVGCLMDIPTGRYLPGKHGESILTGGHPNFLGVGGMPNTFKSQLAHYLNLTCTARYSPHFSLIYDTENAATEKRFEDLAKRIEGLDPNELFDEDNPIMALTDTSVVGNDYYERLKELARDKCNNKDDLLRVTPFVGPDGKHMSAIDPTMIEIDSMSQFTVDVIEELHDKTEIGNSKLNMEAVTAARYKSQIISQLPSMTARANLYLVMTAHVGKETKLDKFTKSGRTLPFMPAGLVFKRVTENFSFLTNLTYYCHSPEPMQHDDKTCLYPISAKHTYQNDVDLQKITVIPWRAKSGATGHDFELIFSQRQGLMVGITELEHLLRKKNRSVGKYNYKMGYGISGSNRAKFSLELLPSENLTRTNVRGKINANYKLRRALSITAEMQQIMSTWYLDEKYVCSPIELHDELVRKGYDWDILLETRGYWIFNDSLSDRNFLSTMDLLKMRVGEYTPYWYEKIVKPKTRQSKK